MLVLLFVALGLFYEAICIKSCIVLLCSCVFFLFFFCYFFIFLFYFFFFSSFSIAITSLGEERANLSAFRTFARFALVWFCLFPFPLGVWEGLWLVIVVLPVLSSYLFNSLPTTSRGRANKLRQAVHMPLAEEK